MTDWERNEKEERIEDETEPVYPPIRRREERLAKKQRRERQQQKTSLREWIRYFGSATALALCIMVFIKPTVVKQHSMEPNFHSNDYLFVSRQSYKLLGGDPQLGDVIVFKSTLEDETGHDKLLIKRVIGVPGDTVSIKDGKVIVNGAVIDDTYTKDGYTEGEIEDLVIPKDCYFCLGDNRGVSMDSRYEKVGLIARKKIIGKAVFRLFPLKNIGKIANPYRK